MLIGMSVAVDARLAEQCVVPGRRKVGLPAGGSKLHLGLLSKFRSTGAVAIPPAGVPGRLRSRAPKNVNQ